MRWYPPSAAFRYLSAFRDPEQDRDCIKGKSFIAVANEALRGLRAVNVWWAEQQVVSYTEFRDGNVPAGYEQLRVFQEALEALPAGVEKIRLRWDTIGYQHELMRYCEKGGSVRFGRERVFGGGFGYFRSN